MIYIICRSNCQCINIFIFIFIFYFKCLILKYINLIDFLGCCSAVAVVNLFESYAHRRGDFVKLSAQELFDFGGHRVLSDVNYVMSNGLMYEKDWPMTNSIFEHSRELHSRVNLCPHLFLFIVFIFIYV